MTNQNILSQQIVQEEGSLWESQQATGSISGFDEQLVAPSIKQPNRIVGPGLFESILWLGAFVVLQIVLGLAFMGGAMAWATSQGVSIQQFDFSTLSPKMQLMLVGGPSLLTYIVLFPLGLWRLSPQPSRQLNFSLPTYSQTLLSISLMIPLTIIADAIFRSTEELWLAWIERTPQLAFLNGTNVQELLNGFEGVAFPLMLFFVAVVPAVGEEFLFRGLIGRGLVSRWGVTFGVLLTSLFFAAVHMYPPHVAAILPVGVAIHIVYLTTKSFWVPMLFHFLNNALATLMMRSASEEQTPPSWMLYAAVAYALWCIYWLYQSRTQTTDQQTHVDAEVITTRFSKTYVIPTLLAALIIGLELAMIADEFKLT